MFKESLQALKADSILVSTQTEDMGKFFVLFCFDIRKVILQNCYINLKMS